MAAKVQFVKSQMASGKVVIFSKSYCPYCKMAKEALASCGLKKSDYYIILELDNMDDGDEIQDALKEITGSRSVPKVFIGGKFVGGGTDVKDLLAKGELKPMLERAGAL